MELNNALKRDKIEAKKEIKITRAENRFPWLWLMFAVGMILIGLGILKRR
jgi:archaellum biogenesis protein FlaJ (TadC family)